MQRRSGVETKLK